MTVQSALQSRQERKALFAQRGQIAPNAAKRLCASQTTETARDLLLHFDHAQIPFSEIVVKIHAQIFQKAEDGLLVDAQTVEQIAGSTLWTAAFCASRGRGPGSEAISFIQQAQKRRFPGDDFQRMQPALSFGSCLFGGGLHVQEQRFEIGGPNGVLLFGQKDQLPQEMYDAEGVLALIQEIRSPAIRDGDAGEVGQNPDRGQCLMAAAGIDMIVGEGGSAGGMHPRALALHIQPGFILMNDLGLDQGGFDVLLDVRQIGRTALDQAANGAFAHLDSQQVSHDLCGSRQGQQLLLHQIHRHRSNRWSILDGSRHLLGKTSRGDVVALRTSFLVRPIFLHELTRGRHIMDLSAFDMTGGDCAQIMVTGFTLLHPLLDDLIGQRRPGQARPLVSRLPSPFLLAFLPQTFRLARERSEEGGRPLL